MRAPAVSWPWAHGGGPAQQTEDCGGHFTTSAVSAKPYQLKARFGRRKLTQLERLSLPMCRHVLVPQQRHYGPAGDLRAVQRPVHCAL